MAQTELDCKSLNCPMPIVKISRAFKALEVGDTLLVIATDPAFKADVEAWVRKTGHTIVSFKPGATQEVIIQKNEE